MRGNSHRAADNVTRVMRASGVGKRQASRRSAALPTSVRGFTHVAPGRPLRPGLRNVQEVVQSKDGPR